MAECALPQMFGNKLIQAPDLVLVAGGEGVIGGKLFYDLLRAEFNVRCLVRLEDEARVDRKPGVEFFYCDPLSGDIPESAFEGVKFVVNVVSPLNTGSLSNPDGDALERLNNVLITRSKAKGISRYVVLSSANVGQSTEGGDIWPGICWHLEYSAINSGLPYTVFRSGLILGDQNSAAIAQIASQGSPFSLFGKKSPLFVTPMGLVTEAIARCLRSSQAANRTYNVTLDTPVGRRELPRIRAGAAKGGSAEAWETELQIKLSSSRRAGDAHSVSELELRPQDFEQLAHGPNA